MKYNRLANITLLRSALAAILMLLLPTAASGYDFAVDGIYYNITDGLATVTNNGSTGCYSGDVVIPQEVTYQGLTYPVTAIGRSAFMLSSLTHITLPNTITSIGDNAFAKCSNLADIDLPSSLKDIGSYAFTMCDRFISVTIPDSVTTIADYAFYACTGLKTLTIGPSVTSIGNNAFRALFELNTLIWNAKRCSTTGSMDTYSVSSVEIGDDVELIPDYFLNGSKVTSVIVPNSVFTIGDSAFYSCSSLKSVTLGSGIANIGKSIFYGCNQMVELTCLASAPPGFIDTEFGLFKELDDYARVTLHVLPASVEAYQSAVIWMNFTQILGDVTTENLPGDVNGDGDITIADANKVIEVIINGGGSSGGHNHAPTREGKSINADLNSDGEVNIGDLNAIIEYILNH